MKTKELAPRSARKRMLRIAVEYGTTLIVGIILYKLCRPYAVAYRGNERFGGEVLMLAMPVWYGIVKSVIRDGLYAVRAWKEHQQ